MGLAGLAMAFLGAEMDKDWKIRVSDWETDVLTKRQIDYAANDALVATNILLKITLETLVEGTKVKSMFELSRESLKVALPFVELPFRASKGQSPVDSNVSNKPKNWPNQPTQVTHIHYRTINNNFS